jgi:HAD superfamily hydrolase (TIGR01509 family)
MVAEIEANIGRPLAKGWAEEFDPLYREALASELQPVDGVVEALDAITIPTCVASSGSHEKMRFTLGLTGLLERFDGRIFSASEVANGKPAPDLFLYAAGQMGAEPAAGMHAFGYAGGLTPARRLEGPNTVVFDDMRDLPRLLGATDD